MNVMSEIPLWKMYDIVVKELMHFGYERRPPGTVNNVKSKK